MKVIVAVISNLLAILGMVVAVTFVIAGLYMVFLILLIFVRALTGNV